MGNLILFSEHRADRSRPTASGRTAFFFDLACPWSYLAAERVERILGEVDWIPAAGSRLSGGQGRQGPAGWQGRQGQQGWAGSPSVRRLVERRAAELRLPLVWPDRFPADAPSALRAAAYAAEIGAGARFALAASRLAFCGGFDLQDPEILAEAAAAAGMPLDECLAAAGDPTRDESLDATARGLENRGVRRLPAIRVGHRFFDGDRAVVEAAALQRALAVYGSPLAPVG